MRRICIGVLLASLVTSFVIGPVTLAAPRKGSLDTADKCVPIIFVHGLRGSPDGWNAWEEYYSEQCDADVVTAIDYDNLHDFTNPSVRNVLKGTILDFADKSPNGKVDIVAHSMGGLLSRWLLAMDPDAASRVRSLTMLGTPNHGSPHAYWLRMSDMMSDPEKYGLTQHPQFEAGQRAYRAYRDEQRRVEDHNEPFREWLGTRVQTYLAGIDGPAARLPAGSGRVRTTERSGPVEAVQPYTQGFEMLAAFYAGARYSNAQSNTNLPDVVPIWDPIRPVPVDLIEEFLSNDLLTRPLAPMMDQFISSIAIDRLMPAYLDVRVGSEADGSAKILRVPTNPRLLVLNELAQKPSPLHVYTGVAGTADLRIQLITNSLLMFIDPGLDFYWQTDGVVPLDSVMWGELGVLDRFGILSDTNHLSVDDLYRRNDRGLRTGHLLADLTVNLLFPPTDISPSGQVVIDVRAHPYGLPQGPGIPLRDGPASGEFLLSRETGAGPDGLIASPVANELEIWTGQPLPLTLELETNDVEARVLVTIEDSDGTPASWQEITIPGLVPRQVQFDHLPSFGRIMVSTSGSVTVRYWYGADAPKRPIPLMGATATAFVLDTSGSMTESFGTTTKITTVMTVAEQVMQMLANANELSGGQHLLAVIPFESGATVPVPLGTDTLEAVATARTLYAWGGTNIGEALIKAYLELMQADAPSRNVVLMTDGLPQTGLNQQQIIETVVPLLAKQGITVTTIGVGDPHNFDEDFLRALAEAGQGSYFHGGDTYQLRNAFFDSYHASTGDDFVAFDGVVAQDETVTAGTISVARSNPLDITLNWPGSDLELIMVDPRGREVDEDYPGATWLSRELPRRLVIERPMRGEWMVKVKGLDVPGPTEPFHVSISTLAGEPATGVGETLAIAFVVLCGAALAAHLLRTAAKDTVGDDRSAA